MTPHELITGYLLGNLSETETAELDRLLADDRQLRKEFSLAAATDAAMRETAFERAHDELTSVESPRSSASLRWASILIMAATMLLAVGFYWLISQPTTIATLTSSENAAWESDLPTTPGSKLCAGDLSLRSGLATIVFTSGAELTLEAPASLKLLSPMRAQLASGAAVMNVPESATGFVLETPNGYAVDYGTQFTAKVTEGGRSDFEVIEGEISVHLPNDHERVRLTDRQLASIRGQKLTKAQRDDEDSSGGAEILEQTVRLGTNGKATYAIRNDRHTRRFHGDMLMVKWTGREEWENRGFLGFDLTQVDVRQFNKVRLRLNAVPSGTGFAARVPKVNRFRVYAIAGPSNNDWQPGALWRDLPDVQDATLVGSFDVPRSKQRGNFTMESDDLMKFLQAHDNQPITVILKRETGAIKANVSGPGLCHAFASDSHAEGSGPVLEFAF